MKLPLKEPTYARYLHVSPDNIIHIFMPIVGGTDIGLDNTCKAVYALQEFFDKGSNSNKKASLKAELLAYKMALEDDLSLLGADSILAKPKQERLAQIEAYLKVLTNLEQHPEFNCLNSGFPSYPRPLEEFMQDRANSNLYSMVLRPTVEDGFLRSEAANPLFSVAHKSQSRGIASTPSNLQQALIAAYSPLKFELQNSKSQVMQQVLTQLPTPHVPVDFERLRVILSTTVHEITNVDVDFTKDPQGNLISQQVIDSILEFDLQTSPEEYMEALFGYCAGHLFETTTESPFNYSTQAEQWSIATQFLLGITNIYCAAQGIIHPGTNFGQILDNNLALSEDLAQTLADAQKRNASIEDVCLAWINHHPQEFSLIKPLIPEDIHVIRQHFRNRYLQIKDSLHFDEFFVLDSQKKGHFFTHQGAICMSFAAFVNSPLLEVPQELTQPLEQARAQVPDLDVNIPHDPRVQEEVTLDTSTMDKAELQTLFERIDCYQDLKLKETLLAQLKQERPDFRPQINARKFLQCVAYGQQIEAESLLKEDNELAQELLTARDIDFTDYSGRTFKCSAYEYAWWAKDSHMRFMLEQYMSDETKQELLKRVQRIEEPKGNGTLFGKEPRGLSYIQNGKKERSAHFDLTPLKDALKTYIEAYNQSPKQSNEDWQALDVIWIKVGLPQREVPAHIAQEYCHPSRSFQELTTNPALLDASNPDNNLVRQLKFYNYNTGSDDDWFTPGRLLEGSGLGSSFAILRGGRWGGATRGAAVGARWAGVDFAAIEAIDGARTKDLRLSLERLAVPSISQAPNPHGS